MNKTLALGITLLILALAGSMFAPFPWGLIPAMVVGPLSGHFLVKGWMTR